MLISKQPHLSWPVVFYILAEQVAKIPEDVAMLEGMCLYTELNYLRQQFFICMIKLKDIFGKNISYK